MKINTLLDLWKFRCKHYNGKSLDAEIMAWQKVVRQKKEKPIPDIDSTIAFAAESLLKPEPFTTKILYHLLAENKEFRIEFLKSIGINRDYPDVRAEYSETVNHHTNNYDISFWSYNELVCIVENKLDAEFSAEKKEENIPSQLERYYYALKQSNTPFRTLATLTVFNIDDNEQFGTVRNLCKESGISMIKLHWHKIAKLISAHAEKGFSSQVSALFNSEYFLLQDDRSKKITENYTDILIEKIKRIAGEEIVCHVSKNLGHRCIALRTKKYPKVDFCGELMALSIWFDCYSITGGKNYPRDADTPKEITNKAFPYFDIALKCYYQLEDKKISEEDFDKIIELQKKGYKSLVSKSCYHGSPKQKFLYKSFAEATEIRISNEESLKEQINNADSGLWTFLETEISNWKELVLR